MVNNKCWNWFIMGRNHIRQSLEQTTIKIITVGTNLVLKDFPTDNTV